MNRLIVTMASLLFSVSAHATPAKKILVVLSSENKITLQGGATHPTGYFLSELGIPLKALVEAGYEPVFATPKGNAPALDVVSDAPFWFGGSEATYQEVKQLVNGFKGLRQPIKIRQALRMDINQFAGLFVPGGHAPMEDLFKDQDMGRLLRRFHQANKPTALICHGPIALLSAQDQNGNWPYRGYKMTSFSTAEEQQEEPGQDNALGGFVKFYPDQALRAAGGEVTVADKWQSHVVRDRELITGQNPFSDKELALTLIEALKEK